ncbi:hypothetical protein CERSUDRAFT_119277 [Gelatoporia subvermispora B]|uniref:Uncharacterized protein n=1 Tax=Ceriporiopsis subvermispora (strain B) TaxID=914234 RepID=M2R141_CERS8|nr:hypothetical protein CERSUDRAFT_119277 [Gelatoporia subvermispora B]
MEYQRFQRMQAEQSLPCTSVHGWHSQAPAPRQTPMPAKAAFAPSLAPSTIRQVSRQQPMFPAEYGPQTLPAKRAASSVVQQRGFRSRSICATIDRTPAFTPSLPQAPHQVSRGQPTPTPEVIEAQQPVAGCSYAAQLTLPRHPKRAASDTVHEREPKPKAARTENLAECSAPLSIGKPKGRSLHNRVLINEARRLTQTPVSGSLSSASPSVPFPALAPPVAANPLEKITLQSYTSQGAQLQANPAGRLAAGCEEQTTQVLNSVTQTETSVSQDASLGSRIASSDATIQNLRKTRQLLLSFDNIEFPELHRDPYTYELRCGPDVFWDLFIEQSRAVAMLMQGMKPMSRLLFSGSMQASEQCQEEFRLLPGEARDMSKLLDQLRLWAVAVNELTHGDTFAVLEGASKNTEVNSADVVPEATLDTLFAEYFDTTDCLPEPWFAVADRVREP